MRATFIVLNVLVVSYLIHFHKIVLNLLYQVEKILFVRMYCSDEHFRDLVCGVLVTDYILRWLVISFFSEAEKYYEIVETSRNKICYLSY